MTIFQRREQEPERPARDRQILVVLSDTQGGHRSALMDPAVLFERIDREGELYYHTPDVTPDQRQLWKLHINNIDFVDKLAGTDEIAVIHNGEACMGDKYKNELVTSLNEDQVTIGTNNLRPLVALPQVRSVRLTAGTEAHEFDGNMADVLVGKRLKAMFPDKDIRVVYHGLGNTGGIIVDYAHHGPFPGSRNHLKGNEARYYLRSLMQDHLMAGERPPDLVLRGHFHEYIEESLTMKCNGRFYTSHLVITPSMMLMTGHARKVTRSASKVTCGWIAFEIEDGHLQWPPHRLMETYDLRSKEAL